MFLVYATVFSLICFILLRFVALRRLKQSESQKPAAVRVTAMTMVVEFLSTVAAVATITYGFCAGIFWLLVLSGHANPDIVISVLEKAEGFGERFNTVWNPGWNIAFLAFL